MATVFAPPKDMPEPPGIMDYMEPERARPNLEGLRKAEGEWVERLAEWCRSHTDSSSDLVGEVIHIPWGDGAALYMVFRTKPLQLIHLPIGDAWSVPDYMTRGLRVSDLKRMVVI